MAKRVGRAFLVLVLLCAAGGLLFGQVVPPPASAGVVKTAYPADKTFKDRVMGAIMGTLIGDALGLGCHWWYDLTLFHKDFGPWVSYYMDPIDHGAGDATKSPYTWAHQRVLVGVKAGDASQTGQFIQMLLESVAAKGAFDVPDFTQRVDQFFTTIDGTAMGSVKSGRYTDAAMRETYANRKKGISWSDPAVGSQAITSEAAQHCVILAALYAKTPDKLYMAAGQEISLFYQPKLTLTHSLTYAMWVAGVVTGIPLTDIKTYRSKVTSETRAKYPLYADAQNQIETAKALAWGYDSQGSKLEVPIVFEPPQLISQVYGAHCEIQQVLPCAYYLVHRFPDSFENAVLCAVNGGGNNMARAALAGGMSGAMVGLSGIPQRFIDGLIDHDKLLALAAKVADYAEAMK